MSRIQKNASKVSRSKISLDLKNGEVLKNHHELDSICFNFSWIQVLMVLIFCHTDLFSWGRRIIFLVCVSFSTWILSLVGAAIIFENGLHYSVLKNVVS